MEPPHARVLSKTALFEGFSRLWSLRLVHRTHDGGWSAPHEREVLERAASAAVLPYDPDADAVVLIEQFRHGAFLAGRAPFTLEPPAGLLDRAGGDPLALARREAQEESGCAIGAIERICTFLVSPGCMTETVHVWCGRVDSRGAGGVHGLKHEGEDIRVHVVPCARAFADLDAGRFEVGLTIICLQWLRLHRAALRAKWRAGA